VKNEDDLEIFVDLLRRSRQMEVGPANPYGEYSEVELEAIRRDMRKMTLQGGGKGIIVFKEIEDGGVKPVSVAAVTNLGTRAYISNVETLPSERRNGYGRVATSSAAVELSSEICHVATLLNTDPVVCLTTEQDQVPSKLFGTMRFTDGFRAIGYTKD
jgi:hypothetical protein